MLALLTSGVLHFWQAIVGFLNLVGPLEYAYRQCHADLRTNSRLIATVFVFVSGIKPWMIVVINVFLLRHFQASDVSQAVHISWIVLTIASLALSALMLRNNRFFVAMTCVILTDICSRIAITAHV